MKKIAKTFAVLSVAVLALAGCSSYSEIAKWESKTTVNDGEVPLASFVTQNFSYELLWCIPLCTGLPWTEGAGDEGIEDRYNVRLFANEATIDGNLASLNHALDLVGSHRITQLKTVEDDSKAWSLFLINRHEVRTQCLILPEDERRAAEAKAAAEREQQRAALKQIQEELRRHREEREEKIRQRAEHQALENESETKK